MQRGVFEPYAKERAVQILRGYFNLSAQEVDKEVERFRGVRGP